MKTISRKIGLLFILLAGCSTISTIDYSHRVRAPAVYVEWHYVENAGKVCRQLSPAINYFHVACTVFPNASSYDDPDPTHWMRAIVVVPISEKNNPGRISRHEQGHVDGFDH